MRNSVMEIDPITGSKLWILDGKLHNQFGPAVEHPDGTKLWFYDGKLHRDNGPAVECCTHHQYWYQFGKLVKAK